MTKLDFTFLYPSAGGAIADVLETLGGRSQPKKKSDWGAF